MSDNELAQRELLGGDVEGGQSPASKAKTTTARWLMAGMASDFAGCIGAGVGVLRSDNSTWFRRWCGAAGIGWLVAMGLTIALYKKVKDRKCEVTTLKKLLWAFAGYVGALLLALVGSFIAFLALRHPISVSTEGFAWIAWMSFGMQAIPAGASIGIAIIFHSYQGTLATAMQGRGRSTRSSGGHALRTVPSRRDSSRRPTRVQSKRRSSRVPSPDQSPSEEDDVAITTIGRAHIPPRSAQRTTHQTAYDPPIDSASDSELHQRSGRRASRTSYGADRHASAPPTHHASIAEVMHGKEPPEFAHRDFALEEGQTSRARSMGKHGASYSDEESAEEREREGRW